MNTSVRTKAHKKQSSLSASTPVDAAEAAALSPLLQKAMLQLEHACAAVLEADGEPSRDAEYLTWQQRFINIAAPVSLALAEIKGPRHFHYHYRHRADDESVLHPILEDPVVMLAQVCADTLKQCEQKLIGIRDRELLAQQRNLEQALRNFITQYQAL